MVASDVVNLVASLLSVNYLASIFICYRVVAIAANAATMLMQNASTNGTPPPAKRFLGAGALDFVELATNAAASGDLNFPRRERFVFRPNHLDILERYFQDNNYPSFETREEIAQACNGISEAAGEQDLFFNCHIWCLLLLCFLLKHVRCVSVLFMF